MPDVDPTFKNYDERVAQGLMKANADAPGMPGFLGCEFTDIGPGRLVAALEVRDELLTPFGNLHGGVMAGLVDHVLGCVLYPLMERGQWAATTEFKLNYLAPVSTGQVIAESTVLSMTRRTAVVQVRVTNKGRLACIAQGTLLITDPKK